MNHHDKWVKYMRDRVGDYAFRSRTRYKSVAIELAVLGLSDEHLLVDVGAGTTQFDYFLRTDMGFNGRYLPVDATLDGTDLETWTPAVVPDFAVAIEVIEHLHDAERMLGILEHVKIASVITTPNPAVVDVIACDPTHVSVIPEGLLRRRGWRTSTESLFGKPHDTIVATFSVDKRRG